MAHVVAKHAYERFTLRNLLQAGSNLFFWTHGPWATGRGTAGNVCSRVKTPVNTKTFLLKFFMIFQPGFWGNVIRLPPLSANTENPPLKKFHDFAGQTFKCVGCKIFCRTGRQGSQSMGHVFVVPHFTHGKRCEHKRMFRRFECLLFPPPFPLISPLHGFVFLRLNKSHQSYRSFYFAWDSGIPALCDGSAAARPGADGRRCPRRRGELPGPHPSPAPRKGSEGQLPSRSYLVLSRRSPSLLNLQNIFGGGGRLPTRGIMEPA